MVTHISSDSGFWPVDPEKVSKANRAQRIFASWTTDILVYLLVLNLWVEYSEAKVIDSFTISVLMAIVLKVLLVVITAGKKRVWNWARWKRTPAYTIAGALGVWAILFFSKFLVLEVEDVLFGDHVELGTFVDVLLLVASLVITREVVERVYVWLGRN
jgi:hypothetical protein